MGRGGGEQPDAAAAVCVVSEGGAGRQQCHSSCAALHCKMIAEATLQVIDRQKRR